MSITLNATGSRQAVYVRPQPARFAASGQPGQQRLNTTDNLLTAIAKLTESNFGAMKAIQQILAVPGDNTFDDSTTLLPVLDSLGIYGSRIWQLFDEICGKNAEKTVGLLRATQLGIISRETLNTAIDNRGKGLNVDEVVTAFKAQLSAFDCQA